MRCPYCGSVIDDNARFCPSCGEKLNNNIDNNESEIESVSDDVYHQEDYYHDSSDADYRQIYDDEFDNSDDDFGGDNGGNSRIAIIAFAAIAVIACIVLILFARKDKKEVSTETNKPEVTEAAASDEVSNDGEAVDVITDSDEEEGEENYFPANATYNEENGHHYAVFDYTDYGLYESFNAWERFCEEQGGHLAVISDHAENQFIYQYLRDLGLTLAFFGYTDQDYENEWTWVDDSATYYTNWAPGQPNNGTTTKSKKAENYAQFSKDTKDGRWNDSQIAVNSYKFVCEWDY